MYITHISVPYVTGQLLTAAMASTLGNTALSICALNACALLAASGMLCMLHIMYGAALSACALDVASDSCICCMLRVELALYMWSLPYSWSSCRS